MAIVSPMAFNGACHAAIKNELAIVPDGGTTWAWNAYAGNLRENFNEVGVPLVDWFNGKKEVINGIDAVVYEIIYNSSTSVLELVLWTESPNTLVSTDLTQLDIKNATGSYTLLESASSFVVWVAGIGFNGYKWSWASVSSNNLSKEKVNIISIQ